MNRMFLIIPLIFALSACSAPKLTSPHDPEPLIVSVVLKPTSGEIEICPSENNGSEESLPNNN